MNNERSLQTDMLAEFASFLAKNQDDKALGVLKDALERDAQSAEFVPALIATLGAGVRRATALACVDAARKVWPDDTDLTLFRVDVLIRLGMLDIARQALAELPPKAHTPVYWQHKLAVEVEADQLAAALCGLAHAQQTQLKSQGLLHAEIKVLLAQGAYDTAAQKSEGALRAHPNAPRFHIQHVRLILARDGAHAALPVAQSVSERFKDSLHAQLILADCLRAVGQRSAAIRRLNAIAQQVPQSVLPRVKLARIHLELGHHDKALADVQAARKIDAGIISVELTYADILIKLGRREDATTRLKWLVGNDQVTPSILVKLVNSLLELRQLDEADSYASLAFEKFPNSAILSENLLLQGATDGGEAAQSDPHMSATRRRALTARCALDSLDSTRALAIMRKAPTARRDPKEISLIAQALVQANKILLAWRYLRACLRFWRAEPLLVSLFAQAANKCGRQREAISVLRVAGAGAPQDAPAFQSNLMLLHAAIGESDAAFTAFQTCLEQGGFPQQNAYRLLLRCMIGDGRADPLARLIDTQETSGLWKVPHPQKSFHGQLTTEVKIALASGADSPTQDVDPQSRTGHVALMQDHPVSNVAAMRVLRHWLVFGPPARRAATVQIPHQIVQYWDKATPPPRIAEMMDTWQTRPGFGYRRFDRLTAAAYLHDTYGPRAVKAFRLARNPAEEADFFRLCLLAIEGGIYADADDRLIADLRRVLPTGASFVALLEPGLANIGNNFIAAAAQHPLLIDAVGRAQSALLSRSSETTWSKTGPGLLTRALAHELTRCPQQDAGDGIAVLTLADITGTIAIHNVSEHKRAATDWRVR